MLCNITQSRRNLTRNERSIVNCMVHAGHSFPEINRELVAMQAELNLPLRLMSDGYLARIRSQFKQFERWLDGPGARPEQAQYGIDMLEAGYSWSGADASCIVFTMPKPSVIKLRSIYLDENGEAIR